MRKKKEPIKLFPIVRSQPKSSISCSKFQFRRRGREDAVVRPENRETKVFPLTSCNDQINKSHLTSRDSTTPKSNGCPSMQFVRSNNKEAVIKNANEGAKVFLGSSERPKSRNQLSSHFDRGNKDDDAVSAENKGSGTSFSFYSYADSRTGSPGIINKVIPDVVILESDGSKVFPQSSVNGRSSLFDSYANSSGSSR